ncbi:MAG: DUF4175 domain-containing protein [Alphaproteobacteria bacterium]|nr:DUF4175 domain-containing protein [Alphaproteobacteria bacterium]
MAKSHDFHERLTTHEPARGSDRNFGLVFAGFFCVLTVLGLWQGTDTWPYWAVLAALFAVVALLAPQRLTPLNKLWHRFGLLLGRVVTPVTMLAVFLLAVTPTALILRLMRKDLLRLKWDGNARSYWIERNPPGPAPDTMKFQF